MKAVLFDLDGTIANSEEGITKCVQYALKHFNIDEPDLAQLRCFIGPPLELIFHEKYGFTEEQCKEAVKKYRERYNELGIHECKVYEGIPELIEKLKKSGYMIALASSKPEIACKIILNDFCLAGYFDMIVGATLDGKISSKQQVLEELERRMEHLSIHKDDLCLIGDTKYDVIGANQFGIRCVGVTYGFGTREELEEAGAAEVCDDLIEVENYIENN